MSALAACPACAALPQDAIAADAGGEVLFLSLPAIHSAACIAGVERTLAATPGVREARVNLGRRRVRVVTAPGLGAAGPLAALEGAGFEAHELDEAALAQSGGDAAGRALLARIAVAGFAMMNVMVLSVAVWAGAAEATRGLFHWISAAIALPALAFAAQPFAASAWGALRAGRLNMDVPIALAICLACGVSLAETAADGHVAWFEAALSLTFFLLVGRYLDHRTRVAARSAAADLTALELPRATRIEGDTRRSVAVAEIAPGDVIALSAGARAPVDGIALDAARLDRSALTGESRPVELPAGGPVSAGEAVLDRPLRLRATARAEDSTLRRLAALVETAEAGRHRYTALADRAAAAYAPVVHLLAFAAFAGWWWAAGDLRLAVGIATAVLIITCPCALALAVPAVNASVAGRLFRQGVLLKNATALERLAEVDTILLDKTGTLTMPVADGAGLEPEAAGIARALAQASDHPVARALAERLTAPPADLEDLREVPGQGVSALWQGTPVFLGRGAAGTVLRIGSRELTIDAGETLRPGAAEMVAGLRAQGYALRIVTGDTPDRAARIAARLGDVPFAAGLGPEEKAAMVDELADAGHRVLVLGDGINDTAALAAAHASLAPGRALDAARSVADAVLLAEDLAVVPRLTAEARGAVRRMGQNFGLALAYNLVAVPLALAGLATPLIAALAMSASSITVVLNAMRRA
ncbi:heavy metal translocating P-type ATPase [Jannaschia ovalis]|uniref:Heavy metal translocating P-type ATPase n=1 Tax=Jannaschia ovalis TaxID=3038773 RepID=A0ABY8LD08_9RHOB|nr:heavy metal translocating P-type ATPase [Jannaschia sp. GRR-S6-38]WGH78073.1 heavy metal translocating P-type ATPase [Jannaschia sp. GRR-S6-38]